MSGTLVLVATPIGNLSDLSPRAVDELRRADVVACEDTRRTGRLLAHAGIEGAHLLMVNEHTEAARAGEVVERLEQGDRVALVTDAGTPGISDPGERVVQAAVEAGHRVEVVPGPSAPIAALVASGLPAGRFCFEGFLPRKGAARSRRLAALADEERTVIVFEAPNRLAGTLTDLAEAFGEDRRVVVARELTKLHEELWRGTLGEGAEHWSGRDVKGEVVIVVDGAPPPGPAEEAEIVAALQHRMAAGASARDAAREVARELDVPRRRAYALATSISRSGG